MIAYGPMAKTTSGEDLHCVYVNGTYRGRVRVCAGGPANSPTGDYHATTTKAGKLKGRYYATLAGASKWIAAQHKGKA